MQCNKCGTENSDDARFCHKCGMSLVESDVSKDDAHGTHKEFKTHKPNRPIRPILVGVAIVFALCVVVGCIAVLPSLLRPESVTDRMVRANGGVLPNMTCDEDGAIRFVQGRFTDRVVNDAGDAINAVSDVSELLGIEDPANQLQVTCEDEYEGITFYRFQQCHDGIPVYGRQLVLSVDANGAVTTLGGEFEELSNASISGVKTAEELGLPNEAELVLFNAEGVWAPMYKVTVGGTSRFLSANTGELVHEESLLRTHTAQVTHSIDGVSYSFNADDIGGGVFELRDSERNLCVYDAGERTLRYRRLCEGETVRAAISPMTSDWYVFSSAEIRGKNNVIGPDRQGTYSLLSDAGNVLFRGARLEDASEARDVWIEDDYKGKSVLQVNDADWSSCPPEAIQALTCVAELYDYYDNTLHWKGYDNKNGEYRIVVRDKMNDKVNCYSYGNLISFSSAMGVDAGVVGHEFAHSVVNGVLSDEGLCGSIEAQTLNDAYADILSCVSLGNTSWTIASGKDWGRSAKSPELDHDPRPASVGGSHWRDFNEPGVDEHDNMTVISHAAYLMYDKGLTMDEIGRIWFGSLWYLSPTSTFSTCRAAVLSAAAACGLSDEKLSIVESSFDEVGIVQNSRISPSAEVRAFNADGTAHTGFKVSVESVLNNEDEDVTSLSTSGDSLSLADVSGSGPFKTGVYRIVVADAEDPSKKQMKVVVLADGGVSRVDVNLGTATQATPSDTALLENYSAELGIHRYEVDYLWQARGVKYTPFFKWVVGEGIDEDSPIGTHIADFDGDGADELLVVCWHDASVALEMYEAHYGNAVQKARMDDYGFSFPVVGIGCLDVACDDENGIDVQWWGSTALISGGHDWGLDRYAYDGKGFTRIGRANQGGTGIYELDDLKSQLRAAGVPTDSIPDVDDDNVLASMLADRESWFKVITRIAAGTDAMPPTYETLNGIAKQGSEEWSEASRLGGFVITQSAEQLKVGTSNGESVITTQDDDDDEDTYTLRYRLSSLKLEGGNGDVGGGVYVPGTIPEYRSYYGERGNVQKTGYNAYVTHVATIPGTGLSIEYMFGEIEDKAEAWGIRGTLGELVDGLSDGSSVSVEDFARSLRTEDGVFDVESMIPEHWRTNLKKCGPCYVQLGQGTAFVYYSDNGSNGAYNIKIELGADGMITQNSPASISTYSGIYQ